MWDLNSLTRDRTYVPGIGSAESSPLDCQGSPHTAEENVNWLSSLEKNLVVPQS